MASVFADRVLETSTTTGTGTYTVLGAVTGYQAFSVVGNGVTVYYCAESVDGSGIPDGGWEVGSGVYNTGTLTRASILASSNANAAVNWAAGTRRVFLVDPAAWLTRPEVLQIFVEDTISADSGVYYSAEVSLVQDGADDFTDEQVSIQANFTYDGSGSVQQVMGLRCDTHVTGDGDVDAGVKAYQGRVLISGDGAVANLYGGESNIEHEGGGIVAKSYGFFTEVVNSGAGSITDAYAFFSEDMRGQSTNGYFLWYGGGPGGDANGAGVFRVNDLGILAYYNPAFAIYTPGAVNFERLLLRFGDTGVFGTDNIAYFGMEVGGTGTNRNLNILGAEVGVMTIPGTYGVIRAGGYKSSDGSAGATGTATALNTLTIKNGLVTVIA